MGQPALKTDAVEPQGDDHIFSLCQQWQTQRKAYMATSVELDALNEARDDEAYGVAQKRYDGETALAFNTFEALLSVEASTLNGIAAQFAAVVTDGFLCDGEHPIWQERLQRILRNACQHLGMRIAEPNPDTELLALCAQWEAAFVKWDTWPDGDDDAFSQFYDDEVEPRFNEIARTAAHTIDGTRAKARVLFLDNASSWNDPRDEASRCPVMAMMAAICRELDPSLPPLIVPEAA